MRSRAETVVHELTEGVPQLMGQELTHPHNFLSNPSFDAVDAARFGGNPYSSLSLRPRGYEAGPPRPTPRRPALGSLPPVPACMTCLTRKVIDSAQLLNDAIVILVVIILVIVITIVRVKVIVIVIVIVIGIIDSHSTSNLPSLLACVLCVLACALAC